MGIGSTASAAYNYKPQAGNAQLSKIRWQTCMTEHSEFVAAAEESYQ